jgi:hypothetical protein
MESDNRRSSKHQRELERELDIITAFGGNAFGVPIVRGNMGNEDIDEEDLKHLSD